MNGVLVYDKEIGKSSHDIVNFVRRTFGVKKAGHTGTLDPMATGVLPVLIGSSTKLSEILTGGVKSYTAKIKFGTLTDTLDVTGNILRTDRRIPSESEFLAVLGSFKGRHEQIPPLYSAVKINGRKLYEYARRGKEAEISGKILPREIEIYSISGAGCAEYGEFEFSTDCSKGTYIRSLCRDIGEALGTYASMSALRRTRSGFFTADQAHTAAEITEFSNKGGDLSALLVKNETVLARITDNTVRLDAFFTRLAMNGAEIYLDKLRAQNQNLAPDCYVRMHDADGNVFALGKVMEFGGRNAVKPVVFI